MPSTPVPIFGGGRLGVARAPIGEQEAEVGAVHESVPIEIRLRGWRDGAPFAEEHAEIAAVDDVIYVDVTDAAIVAGLAAVGDVVGVRVGEGAVEDLAVVDDVVVVAVVGPFDQQDSRNIGLVAAVPHGESSIPVRQHLLILIKIIHALAH